MICSGALTEVLSFYRIVETQSASGYKHTEEEFMFTCRAARTKNKENYTVDAEELFHTNELTFRLRLRREVEETNIVVYNGDRYRITSLQPWPRENEMVIILAKINE